MYYSKIFLVLASLAFFRVTCLQMPDFIPVCDRNDPDLDECARRSGQISIAGIVKGDKRYALPNMMPLHIPQIDLEAGGSLKIKLEDNEVSGLENTVVNKAKMDLDNNHLEFEVYIPEASILGNAKVNGRVLILPIRGEGRANMSIVDGHYLYKMNYTMIKKKGEDHLKITDHMITFNTTKLNFKFENLFGGNNILSEQMNKFLNENWDAVNQDFGSAIAETISSIITSIVQAVFDRVPFKYALAMSS